MVKLFWTEKSSQKVFFAVAALYHRAFLLIVNSPTTKVNLFTL